MAGNTRRYWLIGILAVLVLVVVWVAWGEHVPYNSVLQIELNGEIEEQEASGSASLIAGDMECSTKSPMGLTPHETTRGLPG